MRPSTLIVLALVASTAFHAAAAGGPPLHGRRALKSGTAGSSPAPSAAFSLPAGATQRAASPLLGAPPVRGWVAAPAANASDSAADASDGNTTLTPRIIQGDSDPYLDYFPYAAYLEWSSADGVGACTGSLIAPTWVLTAAHCVSVGGYAANPSDVAVRVGGYWHDVSGVYVSTGYLDMEGSPTDPSYDLALVELSAASSAPTVMLPDGAAPPVGTTVWAAGYGIDDSGQPSPDLLKYTSLTVFEDWECPTAFADDFCAGGTDGYTCNGDSGGPVVVATESGDVLVGLTSFGPDDCTSPHSYYLRVSDHMDLITAWVNGDGQSGGGDSGGGDSGGDSGGSWGDLIGNLFCNLGLC